MKENEENCKTIKNKEKLEKKLKRVKRKSFGHKIFKLMAVWH